MSTLLLRLEGPLQSWGTLDRFGIRTTDAEPSKSGVVGLLCAAMGVGRTEDAAITALGRLGMGVRVDREGTHLRDYHTAGGGLFAGAPHGVYDAKLRRGVHTVPTERHYLADASFLVALEGGGKDADVLLARAKDGLLSPVWALCLGRKACVPAGRIFVALSPWPASECLQRWERAERSPPGPLRTVADAGSEGRPRDDVPLSFEPRRFGRRYVIAASVDPPAANPLDRRPS